MNTPAQPQHQDGHDATSASVDAGAHASPGAEVAGAPGRDARRSAAPRADASRSSSVAWRPIVAGLALVGFGWLAGSRCSGGGRADDDAHDAHEATDQVAADEAAADQPREYVCPMHPQVRQPHPGTCPICFMDLVPASAAGASIEGVVQLSDEAAAALSIRRSPVTRQEEHADLDVWGLLEVPEASEARIATWTGGRIDRLHVTYEGQQIRAGAPVARMFVPELGAVQRQLIQALEDRDRATTDSSRRLADVGVTAARERLVQAGMSRRDVTRLERDRQASDVITLHADRGGIVTGRPVRVGQTVPAGATLVELGDVTTLWAQLEVFERDAARVEPGQTVTLHATGYADALVGTIAFVEPVVDPVRRTARARVELPNAAGSLRAGTAVRGTIRVDSGEPVITVPRSAVLYTGRRSLVYVHDPSESPPAYQPVEVTTGAVWGDRVEVRAGVFVGEVVATGALFRLDASLQITGGPSMMTPGDRAPGAPGAGGGGHAH